MPNYERKMWLPQESSNEKPRRLTRKSMAEINSDELCGAAIMSSSSGERKKIIHECMAWS